MSFFEELKRRNVVRVGVAYGIAAWVLLQVADLVLENIDAPPWVIQALMLIVLLGFVAALVIAWAYEMTPEGIKKEADVDRSQSIVGHTGKKLDRIIIGFLVVAVAVLLIDRSTLTGKIGSEPVADPVSASADAPGTEPVAAAIEQGPQIADDNSIAVLPFANRSNQDDDLFFTDGIHDDLLTQLSKIRGLKVISRTSMMKYRDTEKSIPEIAAELGVSTILEGGIQRAGKRIRINAQLIDVSNDQHLWAETFDREMSVENIFEIQSEITRRIVSAVRGEMTEEERLNLARIPTNNLEAYEAYLQALALTNRADYSQDNYIEAEVWVQKAVDLDPEFAQAWAMLVEIHGQATWMGYDSSPERFAAAKTARDTAVRLGPNLPETLAAQAEYQYRIEQDYKLATETFKAAHNALPGDVDILHRLAVAQRRAGYLQDSVDNFLKAMSIDPGHVRSPTTVLETLIYMHEFDRAASLADQWMLKFPDAKDLRAYRVDIYREQGDLVSARALFDSMQPWPSAAYVFTATALPIFERDFDTAIATWDIPEIADMAGNRGVLGWKDAYLVNAYALKGDEETSRDYARKVIDQHLASTPTGTNSDAFEQQSLARAYLALGEIDKAVAASTQAREMLSEEDDMLFGTDVAESHARVLGMAGQREEALAEIKRLLEHPTGLTRTQLAIDPAWDFFRDDERFNELARPLNTENSH